MSGQNVGKRESLRLGSPRVMQRLEGLGVLEVEKEPGYESSKEFGPDGDLQYFVIEKIEGLMIVRFL